MMLLFSHWLAVLRIKKKWGITGYGNNFIYILIFNFFFEKDDPNH